MSDSEDEAPQDDSHEEQIDYGRPPKKHQFQKGRSGNRRGRPKGSKGIATMVREHASERVQIKVDGKVRTVSVGQAVLLRIFREGVAGKRAAAEQALRLLERYGMEDEPTDDGFNLGLLTDDEVFELSRLQFKMIGKEAQFREENAQIRENAKAEYERVWGPGSYNRRAQPE